MYKLICQKQFHFLSSQMTLLSNFFQVNLWYLGCITLAVLWNERNANKTNCEIGKISRKMLHDRNISKQGRKWCFFYEIETFKSAYAYAVSILCQFISNSSIVWGLELELVSKELNHLAAILHVYAGGLNFMK